MMDMLMMRDGRNPYGSEGGYVSSRRMRRMGRRGDRGMDYGYDRGDYRGGDMEYGSRGSDRAYSEQDNARGRRDYESGRQSDMGYGYGDMRGGRSRNDGHYPMMQGQGSTYYPIEAMGRFNGYWGMPEEDYGRYDMRGRGGRRDYGYYGEDYGDYGETLTKEELEHWNKKMLKEVDDKYKHYFTKENIAQKARALGVQMEGFNEDELLTSTIMEYTDYCDVLKPYIGENMDVYMKMGKAFLLDKDSAVKGGQKLALYHDEVVMAEEDD